MKLVNINEVKPNPKNPRIIKDVKFNKLVTSIKEFPDMLNKRPLIVFTDVDGKYVVLGGNMRLKACKEIGLKEIPIIVADEWTEEQKNEFLIKDNVGFGEWDWDSLANEWDTDQLNDWALEIPNYSLGLDVNNMTEEDIDLNEEFDPIGKSSGLQNVVFIFNGKEEAKSYIKSLNLEVKIIGESWKIDLSTRFI